MSYTVDITIVDNVINSTSTEQIINVDSNDIQFTITNVVSNITVASTSSNIEVYTDAVQLRIESLADVFKGEWVSGTTYYRGDVVTYEYDLYVCSRLDPITGFVSTTPPPDDTSNWTRLVWHDAPFDLVTATRVVTEQLNVAGLEYPQNKGLFGQVLTTNGVTTATWVNLGDLVFWSLSNDLYTNGFDIVTGANSGVPNPQLTIGSGKEDSYKSYIQLKTVPESTALGSIEVKGTTTFLNAVSSNAQISGVSGSFGSLTVANTALFGGLTTHNSGIRFGDGTIQTTAATGGGGGTSTYVLPIASASILGGVRIGDYLTINPSNGILSVNTTTLGIALGTNTSSYVLPIASATTLGGIKVGAGLEINPISGVLSFIGTTTVASGFVDLSEPMNTNGYVIRHSAGSSGSNIDINTSDIGITSGDINVTASSDIALSARGSNSTIDLGYADSEFKIKIEDANKIELLAPNLTLGQQSTGSVRIGTLYVNRIYNYAGTFAPFFPAGVQFQDQTVQRTAYEPDGGLIPP